MSSDSTKQCIKCKKIKELFNFGRDRKCKDGISRYCRDCIRIKSLAYANLPFDPVPEIKICSECKIGKPSAEFYKNKFSKDGLCILCPDCCKIKADKYANFPCDPVSEIKICKRCKTGKPSKEFRKARNGKDGLSRICRNCARSEIFEIKYGITLEGYNKILESQNSLCAICLQQETSVIKGKLISLSVDHCHKNNVVRGLLCQKRNVALGSFRDNPEFLRRAIDYLSRQISS